MEHVYYGWKVTRADVANPVNFMTQAKALEWFSEAPGHAEMELTIRRIACGMETRGFCGHCTNGIPLAPPLPATQSV